MELKSDFGMMVMSEIQNFDYKNQIRSSRFTLTFRKEIQIIPLSPDQLSFSL